jgi:hypothetical protein
VKDAALTLPRYLLLLCATIVVVTLGIVLVTASGAGGGPAVLVSSFRRALLPSVVASLFLVSGFIPRSTGARFLSILLLVAASSATLVSGYILSDELCRDCEVVGITFPFRSGEIQRTRSGALFTAAADAAELRVDGLLTFSYQETGLVRIDPAESGPMEIRYIPRAYYDPDDDLFNAPGATIRVRPEDPTVSPLVTPPALLARFFAEIGAVEVRLAELRSRPFPHYLVSVIAVCAFATGCVAFTHLCRWKLLNMAASVFVFRLVFSGYELVSGELLSRLVAGVGGDFLTTWFPAFTFLLVALLFIAIDLVTPRGGQ